MCVVQAFDHGPWPRMTGRERGAILYKFADLMEQNTHELAILESLDNGKPLSASKYALDLFVLPPTMPINCMFCLQAYPSKVLLPPQQALQLFLLPPQQAL